MNLEKLFVFNIFKRGQLDLLIGQANLPIDSIIEEIINKTNK